MTNLTSVSLQGNKGLLLPHSILLVSQGHILLSSLLKIAQIRGKCTTT